MVPSHHRHPTNVTTQPTPTWPTFSDQPTLTSLGSPIKNNHLNDHCHHRHRHEAMEASHKKGGELRSWQYKFMDWSRLSASATATNCFVFGANLVFIFLIISSYDHHMIILEIRLHHLYTLVQQNAYY